MRLKTWLMEHSVTELFPETGSLPEAAPRWGDLSNVLYVLTVLAGGPSRSDSGQICVTYHPIDGYMCELCTSDIPTFMLKTNVAEHMNAVKEDMHTEYDLWRLAVQTVEGARLCVIAAINSADEDDESAADENFQLEP